MKKLLILLLLPLLASGQLVINGDTVATRAWVREQHGTKPPVKPTNPPCPFTPTINTVGPVTNSGLSFNFYGQEVHKMKIRITYGKQDTVYSATIRPNSDRPYIAFGKSFPEGVYWLHIKGDSCQSDSWSSKEFAISGSAGGTDPPVIDPPVITPGDMKGTYFVDYGTHTASYTGSAGIKLAFDNGKITDVTPGITFDGVSNIVNGKRRYYMAGGWWLERKGKYDPLIGTEFPTSLVFLQVYDCDPAQVPNYETFKALREGHSNYIAGKDEVYGGDWSTISLSVKNKTPEPYIVIPYWLHASYVMNWPKYLTKKDWGPYGKYVGNSLRNQGDTPEQYHALGVNNGMSGPNAFSTEQYLSPMLPDAQMKEAMVSFGRSAAARMSFSGRAILTSQFGEDKGPAISKYIPYYYKGAFSAMKEKGFPNPKQVGFFGEYGAEEVVPTFLLYGFKRADFERSLTDKLEYSFDIGDQVWRDRDVYYSSESYLYRGLNKKNYFRTGLQDGAYSSLYYGERAQLGMAERGGVNVIFYTMAVFEDGRPFSTTGTVIPFPNGEIITRTGEYHQSAWDEQFVHFYFNTLINQGAVQWYGLDPIGTDPTKIQIGYPTDRTTWLPRGGTLQAYEPGKNGAPLKSGEGIYNRNISSPIDASMAATDAVWPLRDRMQNMELVTYASTDERGGYTVKGGTAGGALNGRGIVNKKFFDVRDLVEQKKGMALYLWGPGGKAIVYYNGFLSLIESEVVTIMGKTFKANGRQIYQILL